MTTQNEKSFEQKGDDVMSEVGKLAALSDELESEAEACAEEQQEIASWITTIGKAVLAIFGGRASVQK